MAKFMTGEEARLIINLSYNIRYKMSDNNTNAAEVARKAGIKPTVIRNCIRGQSLPNFEDVRKIAEVLGCDAHELLKPYDHSMPNGG